MGREELVLSNRENMAVRAFLAEGTEIDGHSKAFVEVKILGNPPQERTFII